MHKYLIQTNIPIFHHSIIPSGLHETCSTKNDVISISCTISETLIRAQFTVNKELLLAEIIDGLSRDKIKFDFLFKL
jgi:hypothetical protein